MSALYIHIPYCRSKCPYCSFVSFAGLSHDWDRYVRAIKIELNRFSGITARQRLDTIFFGGGTPTILGGDRLIDILDCCKKVFVWDESVEISIEANPGTVDLPSLAGLYRAGVNRISIGVQSFSNTELQILGRCHDPLVAAQAVELAKRAGFINFSLDLMYGLPGQNEDSWRRTLEQALSLEPQHLSCYQLTIEDGTVFAERAEAGQLWLPDEEEIDKMDVLTALYCREAGLVQYEVSNFAIPGRECRHNINYWRNGEYFSVGAGAVSCVAGCRERREADPLQYCREIECGRAAIVASERLEPEASFRESVVMGLRMCEGVDRQALLQRYGLDLYEYYGVPLQRLLESSLLEKTPSHLRLSARGRQVANSVMAELV